MVDIGWSGQRKRAAARELQDRIGAVFSAIVTGTNAKATWMNAKVDDWVITPRAGRPVELNALWYNALRIAAELCERFGQPAESFLAVCVL